MLLTLLLALFVVAADQVTKLMIVNSMQLGDDIPIIEGILHLYYTQNKGAAFSMLEGMQWVFIVTSILAVLAIIWYLARKTTKIHWFGLMSLGLVMGGALGNLIDRLRMPDHSVIDFVYVKAINFAVFNVADSGITVGAILLCIYLLFVHEKYKKKLKDQAVKPGETDGQQAEG